MTALRVVAPQHYRGVGESLATIPAARGAGCRLSGDAPGGASEALVLYSNA